MRVCIIGTGYVGLVSAACFAEMGNDVRCVDVNPKVISLLQSGRVHIFEPGLEDLVRRNYTQGRLRFTTSLEEGICGVSSASMPGTSVPRTNDSLQSGSLPADFAFICVGTPPQPDGSCDLSYVEQVATHIGQCMDAPLIIVDKSTVPVGTADRVRELVTASLANRQTAMPFDVVSNPEFLKEGDAIADFMKPDRVIVGTENADTAASMRQLYAPFARSREKIIVMGVRSAEMTKYAANCMLATKISFINEIATLCEQVGADVRDVRTGIGADHRIGYHFIYPGLGYGGSCFPKDVKALIRTARSVGMEPELLEAVERVNKRQKQRMALRIREYFAPQGGVAGKTLALWGLAFKANTDDMRESPTLDIIQDLTSHGMRIRAFDPEAKATALDLVGHNPLLSVEDEPYALCQGADALLVATEWNQFRNPDFQRLKASLAAPVLFDGRNLYNAATIAKQGFAYFCVGKKD